jgi:hypothetical protein
MDEFFKGFGRKQSWPNADSILNSSVFLIVACTVIAERRRLQAKPATQKQPRNFGS